MQPTPNPIDHWQTWVCALAFSLVLGHVIVRYGLRILRWYTNVDKSERKQALKEAGVSGVPPSLIGTIERLIFTIAIAYNLPGTIVAMMAWLGVKMLAHYQRFTGESEREQFRSSSLHFSALLAGAVSMLFAMIAGLAIRERLFETHCLCGINWTINWTAGVLN